MSHQPKYLLRWYEKKDLTYKTDACDTLERAEIGAEALIVVSNIPVDAISIYKLVATPNITIKKE